MEDTESSRTTNKNWMLRVTFLVGAGVLVAAAIFGVLVFTGVFNSDQANGDSSLVTLFGHFDSPSKESLAAFEATAMAPPRELASANLVIPRFDVNAPVGTKGVDASGFMASPDGPRDVVWYSFTGEPGDGGNAVFGGHVDYANYGPAVFWDLRNLVENDVIEVRLKDGTVYRYRVAAMGTVDADALQEDLETVLGPTRQEVITLITCNGSFDDTTKTYDQRLIVRAERIPDSAADGKTSKNAPMVRQEVARWRR